MYYRKNVFHIFFSFETNLFVFNFFNEVHYRLYQQFLEIIETVYPIFHVFRTLCYTVTLYAMFSVRRF